RGHRRIVGVVAMLGRGAQSVHAPFGDWPDLYLAAEVEPRALACDLDCLFEVRDPEVEVTADQLLRFRVRELLAHRVSRPTRHILPTTCRGLPCDRLEHVLSDRSV